MPVTAVDILWDVDCPEELDILPEKVILPPSIADDPDAVSDYLSDLTGFCHKGFRLVPEPGETK